MNKEKFIEMLEKAKEDEYGRLYVLGDYNNKIYFGVITTICEDIFKLNHSEETQDTAELYDRHFWNDDTFECLVVSTRHDENIKYKEPKRIEEIKIEQDGSTYYIKNEHGTKCYLTKHSYLIADKVNELIDEVNKLKGKYE